MSGPTDQQLDESVATMLRIGVTIASLVVLVGGVLLLRHFAGSVPDYRTFQQGNPALETVTGTVRGALYFSPASIIQLGLLLLIFTPIARVALCVVGFARQRSVLYVSVSSVVLGILLFSFLRGR